MADVDVPELVRQKAEALGPAGRSWLGSLSAVLAEIEIEWQLVIGTPIAGGSGSYVANATLLDGAGVVIKVVMPDGLEGHASFAHELGALRAGQGRGYVGLLRVDEPRRILLLERLGQPMSTLDLPVEVQIERIAATVARGWQPPPVGVRVPSGAEQAQFVHDFIAKLWQSQGRPCPRRVIEYAQQCARSRRESITTILADGRGIVIHGDAHPGNVLESTTAASDGVRYKLIDPDWMLSEPAHDLGIALRDFNTHLLDDDAGVRLGEWCRRLEGQTGVPSNAIWEWACAERVSTGLYLLSLGDRTRAEQYLAAAEAITPS